ncbi:MAG TPA: adenylate/guanylate cyclase domain-containing protein [Burkholderiales bacterium]|nr:adenylate/guanylate cyclase domain-containing protein [Burkholderiales bacterium]
MNQTLTAAVLFADVEGSTALYERLGDAAALSRIGPCMARMKAIVVGGQGRVIKSIGDGIMCMFPNTADALRAAVDMQIAQTDREDGLALRIGFHAGEVILRDGDVYGDTVNVAARIEELAKGEQILTTGPTVALLPEYLKHGLRRVGQVDVRGKEQPVDSFEVIWRWSADLTIMENPVSQQPLPSAQLLLRYRGQELELSGVDREFTIGREPGCDLVTPQPRASRLHGRIEYRGGVFVLLDLSANGTFVQFEGDREFVLRRSFVPLRGRGRIGLGLSTTGAGADDALEFRCE